MTQASGAKRDHVEEADALIRLAMTKPDPATWHRAIEAAEPLALIASIAAFHATGTVGARHEAYRQSAAAMAEQKMAKRTIETMETLDKSSKKLAHASIGLWIASISLAAVQVYLMLCRSG